VECSFRELLYTIKSGRSAVGYYEQEMWREKRRYVNRPIKMSDELAELFRIVKIGVLRHDVKLEHYPYNVEYVQNWVCFDGSDGSGFGLDLVFGTLGFRG